MRYSRHLVSLRTLGLAFAVALSPALIQTGNLDCTGYTTLEALEFRPFHMDQDLPHNMLEFDPGVRLYEVELPEHVTQAMLIAEPTDPNAEILVNCYVGAEWVAGHMMDTELGWFVIDLPEGDSTVRVTVRPIGGAEGWYNIDVHRI